MADSVVQLGEGAFEYCCKLQQIRLSKKLGRIPGWCFAGCGIREITIPQGCSLADGAFYYCAGTKWTFPPDAKNLGNLFHHIDAEDDLEDDAEELSRNESCFYTTDLLDDVFLVRIARERGWKLEALQLEITDLTMHVGEEYVLRFNSGADAVWKLDDDMVLSLEEGEFFSDQKLTALREGTAVVTAEIYGMEYTCKVKVVE